MSEVTLLEVLSSRENRAKAQKNLICKYKKPLISFTMNIAGPQKNSASFFHSDEIILYLYCNKMHLHCQYQMIK